MRYFSLVLRIALAAIFATLAVANAKAYAATNEVIATADSAAKALLERRLDDSQSWIGRLAAYENCPQATHMASCLGVCLNIANGIYDNAQNVIDDVINRYSSASDTLSINCLSLAYCAMGRLAHETQLSPSDTYYKKAERLARSVGNTRVEMVCLRSRAEMYISTQRLVEAGFCGRLLLARCTDGDMQDMRFWARIILMKLYLGLRVGAAIEDCVKGIERECYYRNRPFLSMKYFEILAVTKLYNHENEEALAFIERADDIARKISVPVVEQWHITAMRAEALQRLGRYAEAKQAAESCRNNIQVVPPQNVDPYYSRYSLLLIEASIAIGEQRYDDALNILTRSDIPKDMFSKMSFSARYYAALENLYVNIDDYGAAYNTLLTSIITRNNLLAVNARTRAKDMEVAFREDTTILRQRIDINTQKQNYTNLQQQLLFISMVVLLVIVIGGLIWMRSVWGRNARKIKDDEAINKKLAEEIERQTIAYKNRNRLIMSRNSDMAASQSYARRLQRGVLPDIVKLRNKGFKDSFIVRGSADVTSSCFFWFRNLSDSEILLCTANADWNGVPGAMLSMVGLTLVEEVALKYEGNEAAAGFLAEVEQGFVRRLPDKRWRSNLSISIAIVNTQARKIRIASAGVDVMLRSGASVEIVKGSDKKVGVVNNIRRQDDEVRTFQPGDAVFLFSSNMTDIKGGNDNRNLGNDGLAAMLTRVSRLPASLQYDTMLNELLLWKSGRPLTDDILFLSVMMP